VLRRGAGGPAIPLDSLRCLSARSSGPTSPALSACGPVKDTDHTDPGRRIRAGEVVSKVASQKR